MRHIIRLLGILLCVLLAIPALAGVLPEPRQVSPHAWAWIGPYEGPNRQNQGFRMNLGFVVGTQAVAVIDSGYTPAMATEMLRQIGRITPLPVRYVVNTNSQPHRYMGNGVFRQAGARIVAAREAAQRMAQDGAEQAAVIERTLDMPAGSVNVPGAPETLLEPGGQLDLDLGGSVSLHIGEVGRAHTRGSLAVEVRPDRTVFAGDVLYGGRLLAVLPDGSVRGWIAAYQRLQGLDAALFVPGHGQPGPLAEFEHPTHAYLSALKRHMDRAIEQGHDLSKAIAGFDADPWRPLANFDDLAGRNASLAYLESEAEGF